MVAARPLSNWNGRHVLVTGAASGIGRATAVAAADRGARLSLFDIDAERVRALAEELTQREMPAAAHVVDLADTATLVSVAAAAVDSFGPVDVLVNNAGIAVVAPFTRTTAEDWDRLLAVNVRGTIELTRALLPSMLARGSGHVVIVASLAGLVGAPGMVGYSTSKFALVGFAEALRFELANTGVMLTTVCPGYTRTNLHRATRYENESFRRFIDEVPSFYGMTQDDVASAILRAVDRRRPLVVLGPEKLGWWLKRAAPELAFKVGQLVSRRLLP